MASINLFSDFFFAILQLNAIFYYFQMQELKKLKNFIFVDFAYVHELENAKTLIIMINQWNSALEYHKLLFEKRISGLFIFQI